MRWWVKASMTLKIIYFAKESNIWFQSKFPLQIEQTWKADLYPDLNGFDTASYDTHVHKLNRLDLKETKWICTKKNRNINKTPNIQKSLQAHYIKICSSRSHLTLGLFLFTIFISDPDGRTETTFIKLTNYQLSGTANYIRGQNDKLDKWPERKKK